MLQKLTKTWFLHFSSCVWHPCAGAMPIFSVPFQVQQMIPKGNPQRHMVLTRDVKAAARIIIDG